MMAHDRSGAVQSVGSTPSPVPSKESGQPNYRNENILCAVLALLKELDESGLELVKRDIERKLQGKKILSK